MFLVSVNARVHGHAVDGVGYKIANLYRLEVGTLFEDFLVAGGVIAIPAPLFFKQKIANGFLCCV